MGDPKTMTQEPGRQDKPVATPADSAKPAGPAKPADSTRPAEAPKPAGAAAPAGGTASPPVAGPSPAPGAGGAPAAAGPEVVAPARAYPEALALETVILHHRDRSRAALFRFLASLDREDFVRGLECLGGESIRDRLVHMADTEGFWMSVLQNRVHTPMRAADYADLDAVIPFYKEATDRTLNILHTVDRAWFTRENLFGLPRREAPLRLVPSMVVLHVLTHEFHHKGQICMAARVMGYTPPDLDLI